MCFYISLLENLKSYQLKVIRQRRCSIFLSISPLIKKLVIYGFFMRTANTEVILLHSTVVSCRYFIFAFAIAFTWAMP